MCVHTHECVHKNRDHVAHPHSLLLEQKFKRLVFKESMCQVWWLAPAILGSQEAEARVLSSRLH